MIVNVNGLDITVEELDTIITIGGGTARVECRAIHDEGKLCDLVSDKLYDAIEAALRRVNGDEHVRRYRECCRLMSITKRKIDSAQARRNDAVAKRDALDNQGDDDTDLTEVLERLRDLDAAIASADTDLAEMRADMGRLQKRFDAAVMPAKNAIVEIQNDFYTVVKELHGYAVESAEEATEIAKRRIADALKSIEPAIIDALSASALAAQIPGHLAQVADAHAVAWGKVLGADAPRRSESFPLLGVM